MATVYEFNSPPVKNATWTFYITLVSQADTDIFKTSPTLAAGDITVSIDGGDFANIGTLPTQVQTTGVLPVALTADEMNGNIIVVKFVDAAGAEWQDALAVIYTVAAVTPDVNVSTMTAGAVTAAAIATGAIDADAIADNAIDAGAIADSAITAAKIATGAIDADAIADNAIDAGAIADSAITAAKIATGAIDADALATDAAAEIASQVDTTLSAAHGSGTWGGASGSGAETFVYTVTDEDSGLPIGQCFVWATTDSAGDNIAASGYTDDFGDVTFYLDAGTYYFWRKKSGYDFTNPDSETVT